MLSMCAEKVLETEAITAKHSQAQVEALANTKTHEDKFTAPVGVHVTTNDMFKAMEMDSRKRISKS